MDEDLSGPIIPGKTSQHPLPSIENFVETLSQWGLDKNTQVVVYDDSGGAIAARLWWMLHWMGHEAAAVLNGGWGHWKLGYYPTRKENETKKRREFTPRTQPDLIKQVGDVLAMRNSPEFALIDSRSPERYRGEKEVLDSKAGHIPGALNAPYGKNLDEQGLFLDKLQLSSRFENILGDIPAENSVFYCGSGVSAAHNILALAHAGLGFAKLYPGSWSEWITDPSRPIETDK